MKNQFKADLIFQVDVVLLKTSCFASRLFTAECKEKIAMDSAIGKMIIWYFISIDCISVCFLMIRQTSRKIQQNKFNKPILLGHYNA